MGVSGSGISPSDLIAFQGEGENYVFRGVTKNKPAAHSH